MGWEDGRGMKKGDEREGGDVKEGKRRIWIEVCFFFRER